MAYGKLNADGTLSSASKQHEGFVPLELFETKEDGSFYTYYNDDFTVDVEKEMAEDKANTLQAMESAIQSHIDAQAKKLGYDNIGSIGKYLGYDNPFRTECEKLGVFNSNCWIKSFEVQTQVEGGEIPMPTVDELITMMPEYV